MSSHYYQGTIRSFDNKTDNGVTQESKGVSGVQLDVLRVTWLTQDVPHKDVSLNTFQIVRADRDATVCRSNSITSPFKSRTGHWTTDLDLFVYILPYLSTCRRHSLSVHVLKHLLICNGCLYTIAYFITSI